MFNMTFPKDNYSLNINYIKGLLIYTNIYSSQYGSAKDILLPFSWQNSCF